jgi:prepilin signal peptidase PulO-like enzyme (type II secretory pathway)
MNETLTGFAALALLGFAVAFALLMLFMVLVQPIWCVIDCAIDRKRGTLGKVLWILLLILLWSVANWFYGAFAAGNRTLLGLTRLAWALAIGLAVAFVVMLQQSDEFRRGFEREWREFGGAVTVQAPPARVTRAAAG